MASAVGRLCASTMPCVGADAQSGAAPPVKAPAVPQRIVSINLCADQLVLALADRKQIAGLT